VGDIYSMRFIKNLKLLTAAFIVPVIIGSPLQTLAASAPINTGAKVSFTFDDGYSSVLSQAIPTLAKYKMTGTSFIITGCVGMTKKNNTCRADTSKTYMDWSQIAQVQAAGWEIGSHTVDHYCLASTGDGSDCQTNKLTPAQVDLELSQSKATLASHGINATSLATPYGDYDQPTLAQIAKYYQVHRGFADTGYNTAPYNQYIVRDQIATGGVKLATLEAAVDQAIANKQWVVFSFHDILTNASNKTDDYEYSTANLDALAAYVQSKAVPVVNMTAGAITGSNLLTDSTFDNGIANGWATDSPANFLKDSANNGSYPSPTNSVAFSSKSTNSHLFSPGVAVNPNSTYMLKNFINLKTITSGSVGYFVDEYNSNGTWISGQYKLNVSFPWPQTVGFEYKPTSANVASAKLQVIIPGNSGASGYLDNFEWIDENPGTPPPPPPVQTNLVPNGAFDAGISGGWTTNDPTHIVADSANNGSPANPVNSVKMTATTVNRHLFSPKVSLVAGKTYNISAYVNIKQLTSGEVGFYMDEYDAGGNWISGKYITGARSVGANTISFNYTPTSASVASASLQVILVGNSGILAYVDNVVWLQN
jgi:peptidoglycan/xylan/chitin deacetylase (PgdA/CDA1 family)